LAVNNVYSALKKALQENAVISPLLGVYGGTSIPLVSCGVLAETETDLPALTMRMEILDELNTTYGDESFIILVSAETEIQATIVARAIINEWGDGAVNVDGFAMSLTSNGLGSVVNPTANSIDIPISMRVIYRRD
jgi:hypothetical protein